MNSRWQWHLCWHYLPLGFPTVEGGSQEVATIQISHRQVQWRPGLPQRNSDTNGHSKILSPANHQIAWLLSGGLPITVRRDHRKTHAQPLESSNVYILHEGKIPNWTWYRRSQRRPGVIQRMLPSCSSHEGEPHLDDWGGRERKDGSPRNNRVGRLRTNEDDENRDELEWSNEERTDAVS